MDPASSPPLNDKAISTASIPFSFFLSTLIIFSHFLFLNFQFLFRVSSLQQNKKWATKGDERGFYESVRERGVHESTSMT
jgi:hypothetical protein